MSRAVGQRVRETIREAYGDSNKQAMTDHLAGGHRDEDVTSIVSTYGGTQCSGAASCDYGPGCESQ